MKNQSVQSDKPLRVAFVGHFPNYGKPVSGGVARVIETLIEGFERRVVVELVVPGSDRNEVVVRDGITVRYLKAGKLPGVIRYWTSDARAVADAIASIDPDIVHIHAGSGIARFVHHPKVLTVHGILQEDSVKKVNAPLHRFFTSLLIAPFYTMIERIFRARIGHVIVISPYMRDALPDLNRLETHDIPNPVALPFVSSPSARYAPQERMMLAVQQIGPLKNTKGLLEVVVKVLQKDNNAKLVICGTPVSQDYMAECTQLIRDAGVESQVDLVGYQDKGQIIDWLDRASCLVTMTRQETSPMVAAESLCRGVPVIAPKDFGFRYMLTPEENGFFWPDGDLAAKAEVVSRALEHQWDREHIAASAQNAFHPQRVCDKTLDVYAKILSHNG